MPQDDEVVVEEPEVKAAAEAEEESEEEPEVEESEEETDEEKPEPEPEEDLLRVSYTDVRKEFPDFFKKFPQLKTAFFREQEFTKRFPNIQDADEAVEAIESFKAVEDTVKAGNVYEFLNQVSGISDKAVDRFAANFLPALYEQNQKAYFKITAPLVRNVLAEVLEAGTENGNQNIINAAKVVHQAIFRDDKYGKVPLGERPVQTEEDDEFVRDKQEFYGSKHNELIQTVTTDLRSKLESEVGKSVDPTKSMRSGIKKIIVDKIIAEVDAEIRSDPNHMARIMSLWSREKRSKYSGRYKDSIITAYLSRARASIPNVRKRIRAEILDTQVKDDKNIRDKVTSRKTTVPTGSASRGTSRTISVADARDKKLSDKDIIARS